MQSNDIELYFFSFPLLEINLEFVRKNTSKPIIMYNIPPIFNPILKIKFSGGKTPPDEIHPGSPSGNITKESNISGT